MAEEVTLNRQETPSQGLNLALRGGIGHGRQTLIWGSKSAGKSSFCLQMVAKAQNEGKICAWIDSEQAYDTSWAGRLGVDSGNLIHSSVKTVSDMTDLACELMSNGVEVLVVDSISSLLSSAYFEKDKEELKGLDGTKQIGSEARDLANAVKMMNYSNNKTALVLIAQVRNKITTYGAMPSPTGGNAVDFFSSTVIKLWSNASEKEQITGDVYVGDKIFQQAVGRKVNWSVEKNKIGPPNQYGEYNFYYDGDHVGVDSYGEVLDLATRLGIIHKAGAWYNIYDQQIQGAVKASVYLRNNPEVYEKVLSNVREAIT